MEFWENLSPSIKRYAIFAVVMIGVLVVMRSCNSSTATGTTKSTRGVQQ